MPDDRKPVDHKTEPAPAAAPAPNPGQVPAPSADARGQPLPPAAPDGDVTDFIARIKTLAPVQTKGRGRLIFAMDATMSREPTWDMALGLQAEMFRAVKQIGGLDVQLVYFRGAGECRASKWVGDPDALARLMTTVRCLGGHTQIGKVLVHAAREAELKKVSAMVYVGDAMEENIDDVCARAGEVGLIGVPVFLFQEGGDPAAARAYKEIARLTKGAYCRFDAGSGRQLRELLSAVAVYAAGGRPALQRLGRETASAGAQLLLDQIK